MTSGTKNVAYAAMLLAFGSCDEPTRTDQTADLAVEPASGEEAPAAAERPTEAAEPATPEPAEHVAVGQPAIDFTLTDQAGQSHRLSQYRGRVVVLEWINPTCPFVQRHYQARTMTRLVESFPADRVTWLAIDSSHTVEASESEEWRRENRLSYPILQDASGRVGHIYEARTTPQMFVIDAEGVLRYSGAIDDDPRGRNETPTNHVGNAVRALLDGRDPPVTQTEPYGCTVKYENS